MIYFSQSAILLVLLTLPIRGSDDLINQDPIVRDGSISTFRVRGLSK